MHETDYDEFGEPAKKRLGSMTEEELEENFGVALDAIRAKLFNDNVEVQPTGPSETEMVQIALLMRLYDINLALLTELNEDRANEIYAAHERGESFNPPVFIPSTGPDA